MSDSKEWIQRIETYRYSQDDRAKAGKYAKEYDQKVKDFLSNFKEKVLECGEFDVKKEPWRLLALAGFRKYNLKFVQKPGDKGLMKVSLVKQKISRAMTGLK